MTNIGLETWTGGAAADPDGFVSAGVGSAIAREGTIKNGGSYSAKLTSAAVLATLLQTISSTRGVGYWKGRVFTFTGYVYATGANEARLMVDDGITQSYASYHAGNSAWAQQTITFGVAETATYVKCGLYVATGTKTAYLDDVSAIEARSSYFRNMTTSDMLSRVCGARAGTLGDKILMHVKTQGAVASTDNRDGARAFYGTANDL
jgi:hypothetical protein